MAICLKILKDKENSDKKRNCCGRGDKYIMTDRRSVAMELSLEIVALNKTIVEQEMIIDELRLQCAMYKVLFYVKSSLADKLRKQITENHNSCVGEWDGFCYAFWRARAVYRTLEDMLREDLITQEEYEFCEV